jgi:hypothetical protein
MCYTLTSWWIQTRTYVLNYNNPFEIVLLNFHGDKLSQVDSNMPFRVQSVEFEPTTSSLV